MRTRYYRLISRHDFGQPEHQLRENEQQDETEKLDHHEAKNAVVTSKTLLQDAKGNMIRSPKGKIVVVDGLEDYIIVDKEEVLLIFPKSKQQDIKLVLNKVKDKFGDEYA